MIGQIKLIHICTPTSMKQTVQLSDLEKHIQNKCQGFRIECFLCGQHIKTLKLIKKHIQYQCPKVEINCRFCNKSLTRENFKNRAEHQCQENLDLILEKFSGNGARADSVAESSDRNEEMKTSEAGNRVSDSASEKKLGVPLTSQIPLVLNLMNTLQRKSYVNLYSCPNISCAKEHQNHPSYASSLKLDQIKADGPETDECNACN